MILDQQVLVKLNPNNIFYWLEKGYEVPQHIDSKGRIKNYKRGSSLLVLVSDLTPKSNVRIRAKCIRCGHERVVAYSEYSTICWACNLQAQKKENHPKYRKDIIAITERTFALYLKRQYSITIDDYYALLESQNYKCKICTSFQQVEGRRFAIDHDHKTKKVRGILCQPCNTALGLLKDSVFSLKNAINYLEGSAA